MTTPDVPLRREFSIDVPGTPEEVWAAIATGAGVTSWFLPTDLDEREGGTMVAHMGDTESRGTVTGWDPPRRLVYEEPDWAALGGRADAAVTPLVSEFLVEARSGGSCVVRVVASAFGTGADWENEFLDEMVTYWAPYFRNQLRMYLTRFPGQAATPLDVTVELPGDAVAVQGAIARTLGGAAGEDVAVAGMHARVEEIGDPYIVLAFTGPVPGYANLFAMGAEGGTEDAPKATAHLQARLFGDGAAAYADEAAPRWRSWFEDLAVTNPGAAR
jgi:uncharacterized protein YndB with AHSA1/START domain